MANTPQAKKRIRRNERRAEINGNRVGRIRTFVKKVESALSAGDKSAATEAPEVRVNSTTVVSDLRTQAESTIRKTLKMTPRYFLSYFQ